MKKESFIIVNTNFTNDLFFDEVSKACYNDLRKATHYADKKSAKAITRDQFGGCHNYDIKPFSELLKKHPEAKNSQIIYGRHE